MGVPRRAAPCVLALLLLAPAGRPEEGKGPKPPGAPTRADLDAAAARGVAFLLKDQRPDGGWVSREYSVDSPGHKVAITAVAMEAVLAGAGPAKEALEAVRRGIGFLEASVPEMGAGRTHDGFDFNGWGAAFGLRHLAGVRDRWPAGTAAPDLKRLADSLLAWAKGRQHPCGGWSYLTKEQDPRFEKDGSVSFLTGVMIEGIARWDPKSPMIAAAAEDLGKCRDGDGRVIYSHAGDRPGLPRGREESAGRSLQAALVLAGLGRAGPEDVEGRLAGFLAVREEYVKVRTQHGHTPPHMIAGYYHYHAHSHAARALRWLAAREGAVPEDREARVGTLLRALLEEQDPDGSWMDAPCGDRPYATALAVLELLDLRELLFPWSGTLEAAVAAAREGKRPVVVLFTDGGKESRKTEESFAGKEYDPVRERCLWVRLGPEAAEAWKAAGVRKAPGILLLGPAGDFDLAKPVQKWGPGVSPRTVVGQIRKI